MSVFVFVEDLPTNVCGRLARHNGNIVELYSNEHGVWADDYDGWHPLDRDDVVELVVYPDDVFSEPDK